MAIIISQNKSDHNSRLFKQPALPVCKYSAPDLSCNSSMSTGQIEGELHYYYIVVSMSFLGLLSWGIHYSQPADLLHPAWSSTYIFQWAIVLKFVLPSVCQFSLIYLFYFFFFFLASSSFIIADSLYWTGLFN